MQLYHIPPDCGFTTPPVLTRVDFAWAGLRVLVCLPTCGHGRGNRAPCAGRAICASFAPLGVYIYAVGGESCATRLPLLRSARLAAPTVTALGTLGCWANGACVRLSLRGKARLLPRAASSVRSAILRRRDRLLVSRASAGASREPSSRRSPTLAPHTCAVSPTFRYGAFRFVAFALADSWSARLTLSAANPPEMRPYQYGATDLPRGSGGGVSAACEATTKKTEATRF